MRSLALLRSASLLLVLGTGACLPIVRRSQPATALEARDVAVYRTVAESLYVRSIGQPVGIVTTVLDTACVHATCPPLATRWGLDPIWWGGQDGESARAVRKALLRRAGSRFDIGAVALGRPQLVAVHRETAPFGQREVAPWQAFRTEHGGAAGVLQFSPVGYAPNGRNALVYLQWECGPTCGHQLAVTLRQDDGGTWQLGDVLLVGNPANGAMSSGH